jgi:hypothetical protein
MEEISTKEDLDDVIQFDIDKVVCIRFGDASMNDTVLLDAIVCIFPILYCVYNLFHAILGTNNSIVQQKLEKIEKCTTSLSKMASFYSVDPKSIPSYVKYFGVTIFPAMVFFFNAEHMKVDFGSPDHSKWIGVFALKQDLIDLVETIYRGAMKGHHIVTSPIPAMRVPKYELIFSED